MSLSTAIPVIVVLDAAVLGALAYLCRVPFRLGIESAQLRTPSQEARQRGGAAAAAMNRSAR
jgi:hypothetical protein